GGDDRAEGELSEEARRLGQIGSRRGGLTEREGETLAQAAADEASGGERASGEGPPGVARVHAPDGGERPWDEAAVGERALAQAAAGAQDAAPRAQPSGQRRQHLSRHRRRDWLLRRGDDTLSARGLLRAPIPGLVAAELFVRHLSRASGA